MAEENYDAAGSAVLRRWERDIERQKARTEAAEKNCKGTLAELLKQENVKRAIAMDAQAATKDPSRRAASRNIESLKENFISRGYFSDEIITGNEPRPWEQ